MSDWSVPKGRRVCDGCGRPFVPDESLWSSLRLDGAALVRDDRCPDCRAAAPAAEAICEWRTTAPHPDKPKRTRLNTEAAGDLLKRLVAEGNPEHRALCYVLALGLVRRRVLRLTGTEPAPDPTPEELAAEQAYAEARAAWDAARAAAIAGEAEAPPAIPLPPEASPESEAPPSPDAAEGTETAPERLPDAPVIEEPPPTRPPPRIIGYLVLYERETEQEIRVGELALADDQISAVTGELRELFQGEV